MDIQLLLFSQIFADFILCFAIIFLLKQLNKKIVTPAPPFSAVSEETMLEFKTLLKESQQATNSFLESMEESRKKLREVVQLLDKKEKSCREIIEQSTEFNDSSRNGAHEREPLPPADQFRHVLEMSGKGLTEQEIASRTGLTEGEVVLVLDLHRSKKESA